MRCHVVRLSRAAPVTESGLKLWVVIPDALRSALIGRCAGPLICIFAL